MSDKKKNLKIVFIAVGIGLVTAVGVVLYMFNQPARDVQNAKTDFSYQASNIVNEYLTDSQKANDKYLDEEGESKILEVTGTIADILEDYNKQKVVLLQSEGDKAGVSCTFTPETNANASKLKKGDVVTIKGVIRSGATYDEDLEMYENVIIEKSDVVVK